MGSAISTVCSPFTCCYKKILCNGVCCSVQWSMDDYKPFNGNDGNGRLHIVDLLGEEPCPDIYYSGKDVEFYLYTRENEEKPQELFLHDSESLTKSNLDVQKPVVIIVHGWRNGADAIVNVMIKEGALKTSDVNIIVYIWKNLADGWYTNANRQTPRAGELLGHFIDFLAENGVSYSKMHLIGFSVGAHVAGFAGRNLKYGKVMRITALDPSLPGWYYRTDRLSKADAVYLEVVHTNAGYLGIKDAIGHADFYVNGGTYQPGRNPLNISFSHSRSVKIFAETIGNDDFVGEECSSIREAVRGRYNGNSRLPMGGISPYKHGSGIYYVETNPEPPFAKFEGAIRVV